MGSNDCLTNNILLFSDSGDTCLDAEFTRVSVYFAKERLTTVVNLSKVNDFVMSHVQCHAVLFGFPFCSSNVSCSRGYVNDSKVLLYETFIDCMFRVISFQMIASILHF